MGECIVLSVSTLYAVLEREVLLKFATGKDRSPELSDNKCLSLTLYHRILKLFVEGTALRIYPS